MIPTRNDPHFFRVDLVFISGLYRQSTAFKRIQSWKTIKKNKAYGQLKYHTKHQSKRSKYMSV